MIACTRENPNGLAAEQLLSTPVSCSRARRRQKFQPDFFAISIPHRQDAVYPATIVGIPPMEYFYIGGASVKLFLPINLQLVEANPE